MWNAGEVTAHRIRFEGPAALAVQVATALADAEGVELTSSARPSALADGRVRLDVVVKGSLAHVALAVSTIGGDLPVVASLAITGP